MVFSTVIKVVKKIFRYRLLLGIGIGILIIFLSHSFFKVTSNDQFCDFCHVHPHATELWKKSTHYINKSGVRVHCVECHLPSGGIEHLTEKVRFGIRDLYGTLFKDVSKINWEQKRKLDHAKSFTSDPACIRCHAELFSLDLSKKGVDAHVYYFHKKEQVRCINCHLAVGHYREEVPEEEMLLVTITEKRGSQHPTKPIPTDVFEEYTDFIPGTNVTFEMKAIAGGTFLMGSPESESYRQQDEGPVHKVQISPFWMGKTEVSWDEWEAYYIQTAASSKYADAGNMSKLDVVTGPTPPYGSPDQGWGKGSRPAITMTHYAAVKYCEWLSSITGRKYRLPTEAEWEYAGRGGTASPYFFEGNPSKFTQRSWKNKILGADTSGINQYIWYEANSKGKTQPVYSKKPNPFGLYDMLGNVKEFCLDWYAPGAYNLYPPDSLITDPTGPKTGEEHVIRGGSYKSDAADLRSAARDHTRHTEWLLTDPQSPKSIWWYSDCFDVGFRIVREFEGNATPTAK